MNSFVVILSLSCLAAVTLASPTQDIVVEFMANGRARCRNASCGRNGIVGAACPPTTCPPRVPSPDCGAPNCNIMANRAWHHAHPNPNFFWQCAPWEGDHDWRPIAMPCACGTLFVTARNRCEHVEDWVRECPSQPVIPIPTPCEEDCGPVCDGDGGLVPPGTPNPGSEEVTAPPPVTPSPPVTPGPPDGNCPCICIPCIWWPCQPCTASSSGCPCANQQQRPQPQPLPQPIPEPPRNNPWARPEVRPQPPNQWVPEAPRQPEWQQPQQPPTQWQPQPPQSWVPNPPQNNPWQRPFGAEEEVEAKEEEEVVADETL